MEKKEVIYSIRQLLGVELVETFNHVYDQSQEYFHQFGLTSKQYNVLSILFWEDCPVTTSVVMSRMVEKSPGVSRLVDRMISKKLLKKSPNNSDKRLIDIELTDIGRALYHKASANMEALDKVYSSLADKEVLLLTELLIKTREKNNKI